MKVLITDASYKHTLAAVRNLGKRGIDVTATSDQKRSQSFYSKYCKERILSPPSNHTKAFIGAMINIVKNGDYDVLLPIGLDTCVRISKYKSKFTSYVKVPIADYDSMEIASNKSKTMALAEKIGIPFPKTFQPRRINEIENLSDNVTFPAVIKPTVESGNVCYVNSKAELLQKYQEMYEHDNLTKTNLPIIQEYIAGDGYGFYSLFNQGEPRAIFMHKRIREYPITGGPSVVAESVFIPELRALGLKILKHLNWHGVAMVEFKKDYKDGKFKLMEINPKFWGSLELSMVSGVDFPYLACKMAIDGDIKPVFKYKTGVKFRWLFPGELSHLVANPASFYDFIKDFFIRDVKYDIYLDDIKPNLLQAIRALRDVCTFTMQGELRYPHGQPLNEVLPEEDR